jgi:hypothetical protein
MIRAITPSEARSTKVIPEFVLETVNELIVKKLEKSNSASFTQQELVNSLYSKKGIPLADDSFRQRIFLDHWLDFESIYEEAGWRVVYDRPGYNENYEASFKFTMKV